MNWFYYTMIFGSLPIGLRFVISLSASTEHIPLFSLADFAFWGIMLNTAAIANATNQKQTSFDLIVGIVSTALTHIVFLVAIYCIVLFPAVNQSFMWCVGLFILASSLLLSYGTTDRKFMITVQDALETANTKDEMHPLMAEYTEMLEKRIRNGETVTFGDDIVEFFDSNGYEFNSETMEFRLRKPEKPWSVVEE